MGRKVLDIGHVEPLNLACTALEGERTYTMLHTDTRGNTDKVLNEQFPEVEGFQTHLEVVLRTNAGQIEGNMELHPRGGVEEDQGNNKYQVEAHSIHVKGQEQNHVDIWPLEVAGEGARRLLGPYFEMLKPAVLALLDPKYTALVGLDLRDCLDRLL